MASLRHRLQLQGGWTSPRGIFPIWGPAQKPDGLSGCQGLARGRAVHLRDAPEVQPGSVCVAHDPHIRLLAWGPAHARPSLQDTCLAGLHHIQRHREGFRVCLLFMKLKRTMTW